MYELTYECIQRSCTATTFIEFRFSPNSGVSSDSYPTMKKKYQVDGIFIYGHLCPMNDLDNKGFISGRDEQYY